MSFRLFRLHAYSVQPERTTEVNAQPEGGAVNPITADLRRALDDITSGAGLGHRTRVDFSVDSSTRTNDIRDLILDFAFDAPPTAKAAALGMATALSNAMDRRSAPCLFVLAALERDSRRRVTLWTFPRDDAFQFRPGRRGPSIELLTDVFSRTSRLRKAALFEGRRSRSEFLGGRVLDLQANSTTREVADFWIVRFLRCGLGIRGDAGTRLLAKALRKAYEDCEDVAQQEHVYSAIVGVRRARRTRWSLEEFADHWNFDDDVRDSFLRVAQNPDARRSSFDFSREVFDATLKFHVFLLESGVIVSSPFGEIGKSVRVSGTERKKLRCEGIVEEQRVKSRA